MFNTKEITSKLEEVTSELTKTNSLVSKLLEFHEENDNSFHPSFITKIENDFYNTFMEQPNELNESRLVYKSKEVLEYLENTFDLCRRSKFMLSKQDERELLQYTYINIPDNESEDISTAIIEVEISNSYTFQFVDTFNEAFKGITSEEVEKFYVQLGEAKAGKLELNLDKYRMKSVTSIKVVMNSSNINTSKSIMNAFSEFELERLTLEKVKSLMSSSEIKENVVSEFETIPNAE